MLNGVSSWYRTTSADIALVLLCKCRAGLLGRTPQQISSQSQHTLWPAQLYRTAKEGSEKHRKNRKVYGPPNPNALAARLKDAAPVQPTHRILKVIMQSEIALTSHQVFDKVREEFGTAAFPTRREFKGHLHKVQHLKLIQSKPRSTAVTGDAEPLPAAAAALAPAAVATKRKKKGKGASVIEPYVYEITRRGLKVDLNEPGTSEEQQARTIADTWTAKNLRKYPDMLLQRKVPVTLDNLAMIPRAARRSFEQEVS